MPTLDEYLGGIINSITQARVMADLQTVEVAGQYARHELLRHFAVPRMRIGDVDLSIPVAVDGLQSRYEYQLQPIGNLAMRTLVRDATLERTGARFPPDAMAAYDARLDATIAGFAASLGGDSGIDPNATFAQNVAEDLLAVSREYDRPLVNPDLDGVRSTVIELAKKHVQSVQRVDRIGGLSVVGESHRLREQRPEDLVRIQMRVSEDGVEWQTIERTDGTIERKLLPE